MAQLVNDGNYDSVLLATYDVANTVVCVRRTTARVVMDWVDSPSLHLERTAKLESGLRGAIMAHRVGVLKAWQRRLNLQLDSAIYISDPDKRHAEVSITDNVHVIPNGLFARPSATERPQRAPGQPLTIGFLGNMRYSPNVLATLRLHDNIFKPLPVIFPELRPKIIGRKC